jgi:hypothetical protein
VRTDFWDPRKGGSYISICGFELGTGTTRDSRGDNRGKMAGGDTRDGKPFSERHGLLE